MTGPKSPTRDDVAQAAIDRQKALDAWQPESQTLPLARKMGEAYWAANRKLNETVRAYLEAHPE